LIDLILNILLFKEQCIFFFLVGLNNHLTLTQLMLNPFLQFLGLMNGETLNDNLL